MATDTKRLTFKVQHLDRDDDVRIDLGTVAFGAQGQLAVVAARPKLNQYLADIVEAVNGKKELNIKVPPPKGAEPFSVCFKTVTRTAPDLLDRMRQYLEQNYDLLLVEEKQEI